MYPSGFKSGLDGGRTSVSPKILFFFGTMDSCAVLHESDLLECRIPGSYVWIQVAHSKYEILVNNIAGLACQLEKMPPSILCLDRVIVRRTEHLHWMAPKPTDDLARFFNESHSY